MMRIIFFIFLFPILLKGSIESFFEEEDPTLFYHVNVITGQLNLCFQDAVVQGPVPFSITRTYSSSGAFEWDNQTDIHLKDLRESGWMFQGGWTFLPHANLYIQYNPDCLWAEGPGTIKQEGPVYLPKCFRAYLPEPTGRVIRYECDHHFEGIWLKPRIDTGKASGNLNGRKNPKNNRLKIRYHEATLYLPDGTERLYKGGMEPRACPEYCQLHLEILPNKHRIAYFYDGKKKKQLSRIELQNPSATKVFASIDFDDALFQMENKLQTRTSDGKALTYSMMECEGRNYLSKVENTLRPKESYEYHPARKSIGNRVNGISLNDEREIRVDYYLPKNKKKEEKWRRRPRKIPPKGDKVHYLQYPDPETGKLVTVADFFYEKKHTNVWDAEGILTRYHHDRNNLKAIEYFDQNNQKYSQIRFEWKDGYLKSKSLEDERGTCHFSKAFMYDADGNVIEERFNDHFSNISTCTRFSYYPKTFLMRTEEEEGGVTHHFEYFKDTDLLTKKLTYLNEEIVLREVYFYNEDHLLCCSAIDDGRALLANNPVGATQRQIKRYRLDPQTGLCVAMRELYWDRTTREEKQLLEHRYTYNKKREITSETLYDANGNERYTLHFEYDDFGNIVKKTTPSGRENHYTYDSSGKLLESKEVGAPKKILDYDHGNHLKKCIEAGKQTQNIFNIKGQLVEQIDQRGNSIKQSYDCFGRSTQTVLPQALDENGNAYTPTVNLSYDLQGNLISFSNAQGETTTTTYNALRKATSTVYPDEAAIHIIYNSDGTVQKEIDVEGTETHFVYDWLKRVINKTVLSSDAALLSEESWTYSTFHLLSYTDAMGLTTTYKYDDAGRKIAEIAEDRAITYSYDPLGFLERTTQNGITQVQVHNIEGEIVEQWEEDATGRVENRMRFIYDEEGRKTTAHRMTSHGFAEDYFFYDEEGRLIKHIDPLNATTEFQYTEALDTFDQVVEQKISIDPVGNRTIATSDAQGRITVIEKEDPHSNTVAKEELFYDRAGNKAKRVTTVYQKNQPTRTHTTLWEYNTRGWPTKEIEEEEKITQFFYDKKGRLIEKILPSGITLFQKYDGLDRILEIKSSDGSIHYQFSYGKGPAPISAEDKVKHLTWQRSYNIFGQLTSETRPNGAALFWKYDEAGRCIKLTLPDASAILYSYEGLHLTSVTRLNSSGTSQYTHAYTEFDENGHVHQESLIHNLGSVTTSHDILERPHSQQTPWNTLSVEYGPSGLMTKAKNSFFKCKDYTYDPLDQLKQEGDREYAFDSIGNPLDAQVNAFNQVVSKKGQTFFYNANGNPIRQHTSEQVTSYEYDALNRLIDIHHPDESHIHYTYDPFSRLYAKETYQNQNTFWSKPNAWSRKKVYYLYDQDKEIGTTTFQNELLELKVLGLGLLGEVGATIALELNSETYTPLHDFNGNIIGLVSAKGTLTETCDIDAFGKNITHTTSINPWRFNSKRTEEHLIFFGLRFYDPQLGRWLTPDPAGSIESPNLYLYVRNSPLNRLDLFGLWSDEFRTEMSIHSFRGNTDNFYLCTAYYRDIVMDCLVHSNQLSMIQFTPEEQNVGYVNLFDHLSEILPKEGILIGSVTFGNGVKNEYSDFCNSFKSLVNLLPGDPLAFGIFTPTEGLCKDVGKTFVEKCHIETSDSIMLGQVLSAFLNGLDKVNSGLLHLHTAHSRNGATMNTALARLNLYDRELAKEKLLLIGAAPAEPFKMCIAKKATNFYSEKDPVTKRFGLDYKYPPCRIGTATLRLHESEGYDIQFLPSNTKWGTGKGYLQEHSFTGETLQMETEKWINYFDKKFGFFKTQNQR